MLPSFIFGRVSCNVDVPGYQYSYESTPEVRALREKAEKGDVEAQVKLGDMFALGEGVKKNVEEAAKWYRLAAGNGHPEAQFELGWIYEKGITVPKDLVEAERLYEAAARQGHAKAQLNLGNICIIREGHAGAEKAFPLYLASAEQGLLSAQLRTGRNYLRGTGIARDEKEAREWFRKARDNAKTPEEKTQVEEFAENAGFVFEGN